MTDATHHHQLLQWLGAKGLDLAGWQLDLHFPEQKKFVLINAPHTSNWDFVLMVATMWAADMQLYWFAKHSLFRPPLGALLKKMGGVPIDRTNAKGIVAQTSQIFAEKDELILGLAPEGTRSRNSEWKSGFYQIAQAANVPIVLAYMDYKRKVVCMDKAIWPSGDYEADLAQIRAFYAQVTPKHPERFALPD